MDLRVDFGVAVSTAYCMDETVKQFRYFFVLAVYRAEATVL